MAVTGGKYLKVLPLATVWSRNTAKQVPEKKTAMKGF